MTYKSGFVTIVGRPNVGKSTLLNKILGQKIVITSDKPQTTRKRIQGVYTQSEGEIQGQIVFIDTPGVHKPLHKLGEFLLDETKFAIPDADVVLFLVDVTDPPGVGDNWIVENLLACEKKVILVANKSDMIKNIDLRDKNIEAYKKLFGENIPPIVKISAKTGRNIDSLLKNIFRKLPKGQPFYPEDQVTDQNVRTIAEEIIREKILINTRDEIPHSIAVVIDKFEETKTMDKIAATVYVEHDSQKGIVIGKNGQMLKKIGSEARVELEELVEKKVFLEVFVKVKKDWRKKDSALKEFGYKN
ncbi:MAG: GTPase Era [Candidatus Gastranaerophilales bacterium]|nr:GTPase Era [Candidatus Gastranaerophilales bacterium]